LVSEKRVQAQFLKLVNVQKDKFAKCSVSGRKGDLSITKQEKCKKISHIGRQRNEIVEYRIARYLLAKKERFPSRLELTSALRHLQCAGEGASHFVLRSRRKHYQC
jgi:hypothetical protein